MQWLLRDIFHPLLIICSITLLLYRALSNFHVTYFAEDLISILPSQQATELLRLHSPFYTFTIWSRRHFIKSFLQYLKQWNGQCLQHNQIPNDKNNILCLEMVILNVCIMYCGIILAECGVCADRLRQESCEGFVHQTWRATPLHHRAEGKRAANTKFSQRLPSGRQLGYHSHRHHQKHSARSGQVERGKMSLC